MKEQIAAGYVGEVLACHATAMRDGALARPSSRTWQRDASLGANTLTIATGHVIDALRFVAGYFVRVACLVTTQARQWYETDTQQLVEVTAPDNVLVSGQLVSGAVASVHVAAVPWAGSGFRFFPRHLAVMTAPMIRLVGASGPEVTNARLIESVMVLDHLINQAELRLGRGPAADIVTITRLEACTIHCPGDPACPAWPALASAR
jgi:Oxidoreductase family, C-terminal alpha/beta domain